MAGLLKTVKSLCTPAQLYLVLSVLSVVSVFITSMDLTQLAVSGAVTVGYAYVLNRICQSGYGVVSWILVMIPVVGLIMHFLGAGANVVAYFGIGEASE